MNVRWERIWDRRSGFKYRAMNSWTYKSPRYKKNVTISVGFLSDGATGARDIASDGWGVHDVLCSKGRWDDGSLVSNYQASQVLGDILRSEGRWARATYWKYLTFAFGGGEARRNGMWSTNG